MRKKLEGNGLWESSRMMLPEHKIAINVHEKSLQQRNRIELDEQEWEEIARYMTESLQRRQLLTLHLFHPHEKLSVLGVVDRIDQLNARFMMNGKWLSINDIERAVIED